MVGKVLQLFLRSALLVSLIFVFSGSETPAFAQSKNAPSAANRIVLTVNKEHYTAYDVYGLLIAWHMTGTANEKIQFNWLGAVALGLDPKKGLAEGISLLNDEKRTLLFITFVWAEVKRLNLFESSGGEVENLVRAFRKEKNTFALPEQAWHFLVVAPEATLRRYFEMAIRARTYAKVRGDFKKNPSLTSVAWTWHSVQPPKALQQ